MKSVYSIFLASLVLVATSGVAVSTHYCGSHIASVSLLGDGGCSCDGMQNTHGCCHTDRAFFQVDDDYSVTPVQTLNLSSASHFSLLIYRLSLEFDFNIHNVVYANYKPPLPDKDIPVLIQSFLI